MNDNRLPSQTKYIVGNEACERFSFYGVKAILTGYAATLFVVPGGKVGPAEEATAKAIVHAWVVATYFLPLIGAWIADRWWGRYRTILVLSLAYCVGHGLLAAGEGTKWGLFAGLAFLAIGSGGIKPCVSAFVGDQFTRGREHLLPKMYGLFYFSINFGSTFAFAFLPGIKDRNGYALAFGLPGIAMALATIIFWLGRKTYVRRPPTREEPPVDPALRAENRRVLGRIALVFMPIAFFWALYDQQNTTWVQQGQKLVPYFIGSYKVDGETMQTVNAIFVMGFIPLFTLWLYPFLEGRGLNPTPLRRMGAGLLLIGVAFCASAWLQSHVEAGLPVSVLWQLCQQALLTASEVLVSTTGLEFAFRQAPVALKSTIMSLWLLAVACGNGITALVTWLTLVHDPATGAVHPFFTGTQEMLLYVGLIVVAFAAFVPIATSFARRAVA